MFFLLGPYSLLKVVGTGRQTHFKRLLRLNMKRRNFLAKTAEALAATFMVSPKTGAAYEWEGRDFKRILTPFTFDPSKDIIPAPDDPALWPAFREQLAL
jgi:hypothetical protein